MCASECVHARLCVCVSARAAPGECASKYAHMCALLHVLACLDVCIFACGPVCAFVRAIGLRVFLRGCAPVVSWHAGVKDIIPCERVRL